MILAPTLIRRVGHVIDVLRQMPAASVQCIATSPPFFGLRDYGVAPVLWEPVLYAPMSGVPSMSVPPQADLQAFSSCEHLWVPSISNGDNGLSGPINPISTAELRGLIADQTPLHGHTCTQCGAWWGCLGLEPDPHLYTGHLVQVFRQAARVLTPDGVLWLNLGDSYARRGGTSQEPASVSGGDPADARRKPGAFRQAVPAGLKEKDLLGIPWRAALALQADGWFLRSDIVWAKGASFAPQWSGNAKPESVTDRPSQGHESVFLFSRRKRYFFDHLAVREPARNEAVSKATGFAPRASLKRALPSPGQQVGTHRAGRSAQDAPREQRNLRDVWAIPAEPYRGSHLAVWPGALVRPMILSGTSAAGHCPACGKRWSRAGAGPSQGVLQSSFQPICTCGVDPVPDVVADLFAGSGTTAAEALAAGRSALLIEARADLTAEQDVRIAQAQQRAGRVKRTAPRPPCGGRSFSQAPQMELAFGQTERESSLDLVCDSKIGA